MRASEEFTEADRKVKAYVAKLAEELRELSGGRDWAVCIIAAQEPREGETTGEGAMGANAPSPDFLVQLLRGTADAVIKKHGQ